VEDNDSDYKITLVQQIFGVVHNPAESRRMAAVAKAPPVIDGDSRASETPSSAAAKAEAIERIAQPRQLKTAAELAEMIELDLASHPDCPKAGFRVTVYGGSHWRAMLTITPAAGGIRNPQKWRDLTNDLAERLRKGYQLAWEE